jgi:anti-sigma28 factor (negative regulator of flagellin synthesis)
MKKMFSMAPVPALRHSNSLMKTLLGHRQAPEDRQEKIQSLSRAVRTNSYRIDCRKLADCLITSLLLGL